METLHSIQNEVIACRRCPRLVRWRERIAREKTKRFASWDYWGKPNPGFGDPSARLLLVGLAPAAHGGNRTGRMFTGDRSGDWLYGTLHKFGFANQPNSDSRDDGLKLVDCYITATCRCAPPQNKLLPSEILHCRPYLLGELRLLKRVRVIVGLGKVGFDSAARCVAELGWSTSNRMPKFGHGVEYVVNDRIILLGSFHPSQQNTFTGTLTHPMFDSVFRRAKAIIHRTRP
ncbi:MAG TPA: uracil-DNA glycosylase [Bacteroidota bacterium]|nr:uracil-DNA glycosylase [Bacteroidota bacterium]